MTFDTPIFRSVSKFQAPGFSLVKRTLSGASSLLNISVSIKCHTRIRSKSGANYLLPFQPRQVASVDFQSFSFFNATCQSVGRISFHIGAGACTAGESLLRSHFFLLFLCFQLRLNAAEFWGQRKVSKPTQHAVGPSSASFLRPSLNSPTSLPAPFAGLVTDTFLSTRVAIS